MRYSVTETVLRAGSRPSPSSPAR